MDKILEQVTFNLSSLHDFSPEFVALNEKFALAVIKEYEAAQTKCWHNMNVLPEVAVGEKIRCFVALKSHKTGCISVSDLYYCNLPAMPDEQGEVPDWTIFDSSDVPVDRIGWTEIKTSQYDEDWYSDFNREFQEIVAWMPFVYPAPPTL